MPTLVRCIFVALCALQAAQYLLCSSPAAPGRPPGHTNRARTTLDTHTLKQTLAAICVSGVAALTPPAEAGVEFIDITFEVGDWTFLPAADTQTERTEAFLAVNNRGDLAGDNIAVVLYTREADDTWARFAWKDEEDPAESIVSGIKQTIPAADEQTFEALLKRVGIALGPGETAGNMGTIDSEPFGQGVFITDPYNSILESGLAGTELVTYLVETGYEAALVDIDISELGLAKQQIEVEEVLDALSKGTEQSVKYPNSDVSAIHNAVVAHAQASWNFCFAGTTIGPANTPTWDCGVWRPANVDPVVVPGTLGSETWTFYLERSATRTQTRSYHRTCWDCTMFIGDQTRKQLGIQRLPEKVTRHAGDPPPSPPIAPSHPMLGGTHPCLPSSPSSTNWIPAIPSCP